MNISQKTSATFMIANLIAMFLVILIHYNSKHSIDLSNGYTLNYFIQEILANVIARSAVPIFAFLSGYFLIEQLFKKGYRTTFVGKFYTLFRPYIMSSIIIYLPFMLYSLLFKTSSPYEIDFNMYLYNLLLHPTSGQFWFLRDLMILVLVSPLLFHKQKFISYMFLIILFFLWILNIQVFPKVADWYLLNIETFFFFLLGGIVRKDFFYIESVLFCKNRTKIAIVFIWFTLIILRVFIDPNLDVWYVHNYTFNSLILYKIAILIGIISIFQIAVIFVNIKFLIYLSGLTFFIFLFHNSPLHRITSFTENIINPALAFYFYFPLITILMFTFAHFTSKYFPFFYNLISGNRNPNKSLNRLSIKPNIR